MKLTTRQIIASVTAVTGAVISIFHLILMIFTSSDIFARILQSGVRA